jgi:hypothetical protein
MKKKSSKLNSFLLASIFAAMLLIGGFYLYNNASARGISLNAEVPSSVKIGESFDVKVNISNDSRSVLNHIRIGLNLPASVVMADGGTERVVTKEVSDMQIGQAYQEVFRVVAIPDASQTRDFSVTVNYSSGLLIADFEKTKAISVNVEDMGLDLTVTSPEKILSGEEFEIMVAYSRNDLNVENDIGTPDMNLQLEYPPTFVQTYSDKKPVSSNGNVWALGSLKNGDKGKLVLRGRVDLPDETAFEIKAKLVSKFMGSDYAIVSGYSDGVISPSPLSLKVSLDGGYLAVRPGDTLNYVLTYKNNTEVALQNVVLRAKLVGTMFDIPTLVGNNAGFNGVNNTLSWDPSMFNELALLQPGAGGNMNFSIKVKNNYSIRKLNDKNFLLRVDARIESPTVPYLVSADKTVNLATLTTKVAGQISVRATGYFRDAASGILNAGSFPPKVDATTDFTIHLALTNFSTDVKEIEVRASIEDGVVFTNNIKSNITAVPEVNGESGEIVWKIDRLMATSGILSDAPEAIFQIKATPRPNKLGLYMPLLSITQVKAVDEFTGLQLTGSSDAVTTQFPADKTVAEGMGIVIQ